MADTTTSALAAVASWYLGQVAERGFLRILAVTVLLLVGWWCGGGILLPVYEPRLARREGVA